MAQTPVRLLLALFERDKYAPRSGAARNLLLGMTHIIPNNKFVEDSPVSPPFSRSFWLPARILVAHANAADPLIDGSLWRRTVPGAREGRSWSTPPKRNKTNPPEA